MTYRVIQWATGAMGRACMRGVIDHPATELVGLYVYSDEKAGQDAGTIARREPTGVLATQSVDEILALDADVVVHAGRLGGYGSHDADLIALLESGKNVFSINGYSWPQYWDNERTAALEAACQRGGSTLMSAGINPGFIGEQFAVLASGLTQSLDHLLITESADASMIVSSDYLFGALGFGTDPATVDPNDPHWRPAAGLGGMYEECVAAIANRLGLALDAIRTDHRLHLAPHDLDLVAGVVKEGTVSHINWRWVGAIDGTPRITMSIHWYVDPSHMHRADPPLWEVEITGHPGVSASIALTKHPDDKSRAGAPEYAVAATVLNSIPQIVDAPPGLMPRPMATPYREDYARGFAGPAA